MKLFDYQEDMRHRTADAFKCHRAVMAQMPTGTGKTVLLASLVESFLREHPSNSVWIVAHRRELVSQIQETIQRVFFPTTPSLLHKEGSTALPKPLSPQGRGRRSEPLHSKVGGASKPSPDFLCGVNRLALLKIFSIQWLSRHYDEVEGCPGLVVIDEAHHALAKTYKEMWERYPEAKFLGLTATPCRLSGKGFTDLFEVLVRSWDVPQFIKQGRLATYDFVSIKADSQAQRLIDSLKKRGADGDYQAKEMDRVLNKKPSIERLYQSFIDFAKDRKGIVYAINIEHARAIAEFYREHGVEAVAIDSKTPSSLRKELIERFKLSSSSSIEDIFPTTPSLLHKEGSTAFPKPLSPQGTGDVAGYAIASPEFWHRQRSFRPQGADDDFPTQQSCDCLCGVNRLAPIQVLVNVDIFSEGFDCPDVEFVQLARPTLSLAKYLQMVGRGLRVAKGKKNCVMIDNVGLYRVFGLPSQVWDWEAMFEGRLNRKQLKDAVAMSQRLNLAVHGENGEAIRVDDPEMEVVMTHDELTKMVTDGQQEDELSLQRQRLLNGEMGKVTKMQHDIVKLCDKRGFVNYVDLRNMKKFPATKGARPRVLTYGGIQLIMMGDVFYTRTRKVFSGIKFACDDKYRDFYLRIPVMEANSKCISLEMVDYYPPGSPYRYSRDACVLQGDDSQYYWLAGEFYSDCILIMDPQQQYYLLEKGKEKVPVAHGEQEMMAVLPKLKEEERKRKEEQEKRWLEHLSSLDRVEPYQKGLRWGLKGCDGTVITPALYSAVRQEEHRLIAFAKSPYHWGVMARNGEVLLEPQYEKVVIMGERKVQVKMSYGMSIMKNVDNPFAK